MAGLVVFDHSSKDWCSFSLCRTDQDEAAQSHPGFCLTVVMQCDSQGTLDIPRQCKGRRAYFNKYATGICQKPLWQIPGNNDNMRFVFLKSSCHQWSPELWQRFLKKLVGTKSFLSTRVATEQMKDRKRKDTFWLKRSREQAVCFARFLGFKNRWILRSEKPTKFTSLFMAWYFRLGGREWSMFVSQWVVYMIYMTFLVISVTWAAKGGSKYSFIAGLNFLQLKALLSLACTLMLTNGRNLLWSHGCNKHCSTESTWLSFRSLIWRQDALILIFTFNVEQADDCVLFHRP